MMQKNGLLYFLLMLILLCCAGCLNGITTSPTKQITDSNSLKTVLDGKKPIEGKLGQKELNDATQVNATVANRGLVSLGLSIIAILVSFGTLLIQKKQLRTLKWHQVNNTFDLVKVWTEVHMTNVRMEARQYFDYESLEPINVEKFIILKDYMRISQLFATILNYLDMISLAYLKKAVDQEIIYHYFAYALVNHYLVFKPWIDHIRRKLDAKNAPDQLKTYGHIEIVAERWIKARQLEAQKSSKYKTIEKNPVYTGK